VDLATRESIQELIETFVESWLADSVPTDELEQIEAEGVSPHGLIAPFHDSLVPGIRLLSERSFSTRLGNLHETVARTIASAVHVAAQSAYDLSGSIPLLTREWITQRVHQLATRQTTPDGNYEREAIRSHFGQEAPAATRIDLYVLTHTGEEHYFEIKSPKPNKGQCIEMKQRLLTAFAIRRGEDAWAWWGLPYNPYGLGSYRHAFALPFFDFVSDVKLGSAFWDFVGGPGTYGDLLSIYQAAGEHFSDRLRELRDRLIP